MDAERASSVGSLGRHGHNSGMASQVRRAKWLADAPDICRELMDVRLGGIEEIDGPPPLPLPELERAAKRIVGDSVAARSATRKDEIRKLLLSAISKLSDERQHDAALTLFGLTPASRLRSLNVRRRTAGKAFGLESADGFRDNAPHSGRHEANTNT
jgi:hypothetical protein